mgnify:CR=1 FL=1
MPVNLKGRSFLTLKDFTPDEIRYMLNLAADLKAKKRAGIRGNLLAGKNIVLLFEKTSTRTRCAFEVAAYDEGANVTFLDSKSSQMGKKETMVDTAKVLGRFYDGIEYRGYDQKVVEGLAANAGVPVWNGLTDVDHPTQALADILTLMENTKKPLSKCKLVFCGDTRNNVAYCLMYICAKLGIHYVGWGPLTSSNTAARSARRPVPSSSTVRTENSSRARTRSTPTFGLPWAKRTRSPSASSCSRPSRSPATC